MLGIVLDAKDTSVNKIDKFLALMKLYIRESNYILLAAICISCDNFQGAICNVFKYVYQIHLDAAIHELLYGFNAGFAIAW